MKIKLRNEFIEYLIYLLKSYNDENTSITELKYDNIIKILNDDIYAKPDEFDMEDEEVEESGDNKAKIKNDKNFSDDDQENPNQEKKNVHHNDSDESGIEITTEEYLKIVEGILIEMSNKLYQKKLTIEELFKPFLGVVINNENQAKTYHLELKYLVNVLHDELGINLDSVDVYCLFTKFKLDENEIDEIIDFEKLSKELKMLIADPTSFYLKMKTEKEENNYRDLNNENEVKNNIEKNKKNESNNNNNNFDTFIHLHNNTISNNNKNNKIGKEEVNHYELQMRMNSLDYLRSFLRENKIEFENLIQPLNENFKKNSFSGDIYIDLNLFDEYLESKNLFAKTEFIENLPEIFSNDTIRMALITKDNKLNLSFLKQILDEFTAEQMIKYSGTSNAINNKPDRHNDAIASEKSSNQYFLFFTNLVLCLFFLQNFVVKKFLIL